jgi:hypothetical protein
LLKNILDFIKPVKAVLLSWSVARVITVYRGFSANRDVDGSFKRQSFPGPSYGLGSCGIARGQNKKRRKHLIRLVFSSYREFFFQSMMHERKIFFCLGCPEVCRRPWSFQFVHLGLAFCLKASVCNEFELFYCKLCIRKAW